MTISADLLTRCPLFDGISPEDLPGMLACLGARSMRADKGSVILREGSPAKDVGILLSGCVQLIRTDFAGNRTIMMSITPVKLFAESFSCSKAGLLPVDVIASEESDYLLIDCRRIMTACTHACSFHSRIIFNLLQIVADKNLALHQRALITAGRSTREKLMTYLLIQAKEANNARFSIPFDRQGLADYLEVDRSGLCAEMSKLKKEGVLDYYKSDFRLLNLPMQDTIE
ncbi:MAG: Crp/Fnr family transcriptional regulator [Clostridia bacterium]|nr:Crp/Fnr family transcriptional regulator [Clostridia bacterium]MBQ7052892.1 Crp/Fnr family transcriptional regulator [Clostridia bacterium]